MATPNGLNPAFTNVTLGGVLVSTGTGAPSHTAAQGSLYVRKDGSSVSTRLYINTDGAATWTSVTTAA